MIVKETGGDFEQAPAGMQQAVCCRVYDLGIQPGYEGKPTHKLLIMWETAARKEKGDYAGHRFLMSRTYTASLNERANLRKDLESWRGKPFTETELQGFDLDNVIGVNCNLMLMERQKGDRTYVNVNGVVPKLKEQDLLTVELDPEYTPEWIERMLGNVQEERAVYEDNDVDDADIPF